jgi:hypothetical protein
MVSLSGTVEPGWPVNCSAAIMFWLRKRSMRRATLHQLLVLLGQLVDTQNRR